MIGRFYPDTWAQGMNCPHNWLAGSIQLRAQGLQYGFEDIGIQQLFALYLLRGLGSFTGASSPYWQ